MTGPSGVAEVRSAVSWAVVGRVVATVGLAAQTVFLTRALGDGAGPAAFMLAFVAGWTPFVTLGAPKLMVRDMSADDLVIRARARALSRVVRTRLLPATAALLGLVAFGLAPDSDDRLLVIIITAATLGLSAWGEVEAESLRALGDNMTANLVAGQSGGALILIAHSILLAVMLVVDDHSLIVALGGYMVIAGVVGAITALRRRGVDRSRHAGDFVPDARIARLSARDAAMACRPFAVNITIMSVLSAGDVYLIARRVDSLQLAAYVAANRVVLLIGLPLVVVNQATIVEIARSWRRGGADAVERLVRPLGTLVAIPVVAGCALMVVFPEPILRLVVGEVPPGAGLALQLLALGRLATGLTGASSLVLTVTGGERHVTRPLVMSLVALLVPLAFATTLAQASASWSAATAIRSGLLVWAVYRHRNVLTLPTVRFGDLRRAAQLTMRRA